MGQKQLSSFMNAQIPASLDSLGIQTRHLRSQICGFPWGCACTAIRLHLHTDQPRPQIYCPAVRRNGLAGTRCSVNVGCDLSHLPEPSWHRARHRKALLSVPWLVSAPHWANKLSGCLHWPVGALSVQHRLNKHVWSHGS